MSPTWRVIFASMPSTLIEVTALGDTTMYAVRFDDRWPPRFDRLMGPALELDDLLELRADVLSSLRMHCECPWPSAEEIIASVRRENSARGQVAS